MTDQTPATEAGRALAEWIRTHGATPRPGITADESVLAIEAEARAEGYTRGHWDGLHCDADTGFGILDECEHVGRIYEPKR